MFSLPWNFPYDRKTLFFIGKDDNTVEHVTEIWLVFLSTETSTSKYNGVRRK